jgi:hypothetical protein
MLIQFSRSLRGAAGKGGHVMRKLLALTLSAPLLFAASSAFAADDTSHPGGFAAGVASSLQNKPGLSARYFVNEKLGLEAVVSRTASTPEGGSESTALDWSATAEYRLASTNAVTFSGYAGYGMGQASEVGAIAAVGATPAVAITPEKNTATIGAGVKAEYFFARGFSIFGRTGLSLVTTTDKDGKETKSETNLFDNGSLLGTMGFSVWFK